VGSRHLRRQDVGSKSNEGVLRANTARATRRVGVGVPGATWGRGRRRGPRAAPWAAFKATGGGANGGAPGGFHPCMSSPKPNQPLPRI
jgi:hypothetical protein